MSFTTLVPTRITPPRTRPARTQPRRTVWYSIPSATTLSNAICELIAGDAYSASSEYAYPSVGSIGELVCASATVRPSVASRRVCESCAIADCSHRSNDAQNVAGSALVRPLVRR